MIYFRKVIILETNRLKVVMQNEQNSVFICYMDRFDMAQHVKDRATLKTCLSCKYAILESLHYFWQTKN